MPGKRRVYIETYGCQMNEADSEVVLGVLDKDGFEVTDQAETADVVLVNTCAVRENAEQRIYGRLGEYKRLKKSRPDVVVGVLGCMAERLRTKLHGEEARGVGKSVDLIIGPDEYRRVPELITKVWHGEKGIAVQLSRVETYDDITPLRTDGISAWISVMRGCDKFCTFCIVPFTRGRERSRSFDTIVREVEQLAGRGFREITLLGQNVNSYHDGHQDFADLLAAVATVDSTVRIRFTTSHPQDMSEKLIETIANNSNVCNYVHLPIQSGSDRILELMNRTYDTAHYKKLVRNIRTAIPDVAITTDFIAGFPTETEDDHLRTLELMNEIGFDGAFTFKYSARENTTAYRMGDDVSEDIKSRRLAEIIDSQQTISNRNNQRHVGQTFEVLVEGESKKSASDLSGKTDTNKIVVFAANGHRFQRGKYVHVTIERANAGTLFGRFADAQSQH